MLGIEQNCILDPKSQLGSIFLASHKDLSLLGCSVSPHSLSPWMLVIPGVPSSIFSNSICMQNGEKEQFLPKQHNLTFGMTSLKQLLPLGHLDPGWRQARAEHPQPSPAPSPASAPELLPQLAHLSLQKDLSQFFHGVFIASEHSQRLAVSLSQFPAAHRGSAASHALWGCSGSSQNASCCFQADFPRKWSSVGSPYCYVSLCLFSPLTKSEGI